jgi:aerobic-type carbon monoxide dehydrogenase small subunit (CoxS/CutS family)
MIWTEAARVRCANPMEGVFMAIELSINGRKCRADADEGRSLLSVLRDDLDLTGSKYGCGEGKCGACTVLVEGKPIRSCITPLGTVADKRITTIEGLEKDGRLHPLQEAFLDVGAMQCGYCTAGMILAGVALLDRHPHPERKDIVGALDGNICRCGTYTRIVQAVRKAAETMKGGAQ